MEDKKTQYEQKIATILRRVMEVSYLRKKNTERMIDILKQTRTNNSTQTNTSLELLLQEYKHLKDQIDANRGLD